MAHITSYPGVRHLRSGPNTYVRHLRRGAVRREGVGAAFWFRPLSSALSEVPVDDRELPLLFHARTADFQDVAVQATVTYRVLDPTLAAIRIDFSVDSGTGRWTADPLAQVAGLLTESAQQPALDLLAAATVTEALAGGVGPLRTAVEAGLAADPRLAETGLGVVGVRVVAIRPEPEVERALQTPTREQMQQEADRATYERRAVAVQRERAIGENELANQIALAQREEQLVTQRGTNARRQAEQAAAADQIEAGAQAARESQLAQVRADAARSMGEARAAAETARVAAYRELPQATLLGLALKDLAANLPKIDSLVLTPDLLAPLLARLGGSVGPRSVS